LHKKATYILFSLIYCFIASSTSAQISFYISPKGNDSYPGTVEKPFATLGKARDVVRTIKKSDSSPITIFLRGGYYELSDSFGLDSVDSGSDRAPIVYTSYAKEEVHLIGGKKISGFEAVKDSAVLRRLEISARNNVVQFNLKKLGINNFGQIVRRRFGVINSNSGMELFFNEKPMTLARWPNSNWAYVDSIPVSGDKSKFYFHNDRVKRWTSSKDVWLHGYWKWDWADSYERVKNIDTTRQTIETYPPHGVYGYTKGKRFYVLNVLEEIDAPGDCYLDRDNGLLYFYPPSEIADAEIIVSLRSGPLISIWNTSNVVIKNIDISCTRGFGVRIIGGSTVRLEGCMISNVGTAGIVVQGGNSHQILSCRISETGDEGILISGGDRMTLTSCNHRIENNRINRFSRWSSTSHPGVSISGVGIVVAHNELFDAPHSAITVNGNEHRIEYNDIHDVCKETGDAGAIYMGRDLTQRGIVIRYNMISNLVSEVQETGSNDVRGVYLDDFTSGVTIYGNIFYHARVGVDIGCGRDNSIRNNIFLECNPGILFGKRGWDGKSTYSAPLAHIILRLWRTSFHSHTLFSLLLTLTQRPSVPKGSLRDLPARHLLPKASLCDWRERLG
jgi:hypothetical protein